MTLVIRMIRMTRSHALLVPPSCIKISWSENARMTRSKMLKNSVIWTVKKNFQCGGGSLSSSGILSWLFQIHEMLGCDLIRLCTSGMFSSRSVPRGGEEVSFKGTNLPSTYLLGVTILQTYQILLSLAHYLEIWIFAKYNVFRQVSGISGNYMQLRQNSVKFSTRNKNNKWNFSEGLQNPKEKIWKA